MNFIQAFSTIELKKLVRKYDAGTFLFQQGQLGQTMFIILDGRIELIGERDGNEFTIMSLGSGEFLGEKALVKDTPYQRTFGVRAVVPTTAVEIGLNDIETIRKTNPSGMADILGRVFQLAITRLEKMNHLVKALRSSDNHQRIKELVQHFNRTAGENVPNGQRVFSLSAESLTYYLDWDVGTIEQTLDSFVVSGALIKHSPGRFSLLDEEKLSAVPPLERAA